MAPTLAIALCATLLAAVPRASLADGARIDGAAHAHSSLSATRTREPDDGGPEEGGSTGSEGTDDGEPSARPSVRKGGPVGVVPASLPPAPSPCERMTS